MCLGLPYLKVLLFNRRDCVKCTKLSFCGGVVADGKRQGWSPPVYPHSISIPAVSPHPLFLLVSCNTSAAGRSGAWHHPSSPAAITFVVCLGEVHSDSSIYLHICQEGKWKQQGRVVWTAKNYDNQWEGVPFLGDKGVHFNRRTTKECCMNQP